LDALLGLDAMCFGPQDVRKSGSDVPDFTDFELEESRKGNCRIRVMRATG